MVHAHSWYPREFCDDADCAAVETITQQMAVGARLPQIRVTSKHGTAIVPKDFPVRASRDGRMHVCMRQNEFGDWDILCMFVPPNM